jgi:hypothetical protein
MAEDLTLYSLFRMNEAFELDQTNQLQEAQSFLNI